MCFSLTHVPFFVTFALEVDELIQAVDLLFRPGPHLRDGVSATHEGVAPGQAPRTERASPTMTGGCTRLAISFRTAS